MYGAKSSFSRSIKGAGRFRVLLLVTLDRNSDLQLSLALLGEARPYLMLLLQNLDRKSDHTAVCGATPGGLMLPDATPGNLASKI